MRRKARRRRNDRGRWEKRRKSRDSCRVVWQGKAPSEPVRPLRVLRTRQPSTWPSLLPLCPRQPKPPLLRHKTYASVKPSHQQPRQPSVQQGPMPVAPPRPQEQKTVQPAIIIFLSSLAFRRIFSKLIILLFFIFSLFFASSAPETTTTTTRSSSSAEGSQLDSAVCPICGHRLETQDSARINQHIDECLTRSMLIQERDAHNADRTAASAAHPPPHLIAPTTAAVSASALGFGPSMPDARDAGRATTVTPLAAAAVPVPPVRALGSKICPCPYGCGRVLAFDKLGKHARYRSAVAQLHPPPTTLCASMAPLTRSLSSGGQGPPRRRRPGARVPHLRFGHGSGPSPIS